MRAFRAPARIGAPRSVTPHRVQKAARSGDSGLASRKKLARDDTVPAVIPTLFELGLFYWQGEQVNDATPVMHFQMTRRAYEQMLAITAGSELRVQPSQAGGGR
jgi:hypothetical protein